MKKVISIRNDISGQFSYVHKWTNHPEFIDFNLHTHTDYELYIFIKGNTNFVVEGVSYNLNPYDMLLIRGNELHRIFPHPADVYERIIISISESFFHEWKCTHLQNVFFPENGKRYIPSTVVQSNALDENIERIEKYIKETTKQNDTVVKCSIIELLHKISTIVPPLEQSTKNETVSKIIIFINENITFPIILDNLAEKFFLSKYYMCRIFKKSTGFTINQYITTKRILIVKHLFKSGITLSNACIEAGFGSYTNFYKAYTKEFGISPKKGLKKH